MAAENGLYCACVHMFISSGRLFSMLSAVWHELAESR